MALGKQIRLHRERLQLTLEGLSDKTGVDIGTISALENRDSQRSKFASRIAAGLGLTLEQLEDESFDPDRTTLTPQQVDAINKTASLIGPGQTVLFSHRSGAGKTFQPGDLKAVLKLAGASTRLETVRQLVALYLASPAENEDLLEKVDEIVLGGAEDMPIDRPAGWGSS